MELHFKPFRPDRLMKANNAYMFLRVFVERLRVPQEGRAEEPISAYSICSNSISVVIWDGSHAVLITLRTFCR